MNLHLIKEFASLLQNTARHTIYPKVLTPTLSIMKVGVQPFLQEPADLVHTPLLNILHKLL